MGNRFKENQGPMTGEEQRAIFEKARRDRYVDMIRVLEPAGFKVYPKQKAIEKESMQMISILQARGYTITKGNEEYLGRIDEKKEQEKED